MAFEGPDDSFRKLRVETNSPIRPPPSPFAAIAHDGAIEHGSQETLKPLREVEAAPLDDGLADSVLTISSGSIGSNAILSSNGSPEEAGRPRSRGPSISFNNTVKLDNGGLHSLDEPLPRTGRSRSRGRSLMAELAEEHNNGESAIESPEIAGGPVNSPEGASALAWRRNGRQQQQTRNGSRLEPILSGDSKTSENDDKDYEKVASLTSDSTISPPMDEIRTPIDSVPPMDKLPSPVSTTSPTSLEPNQTVGSMPMPMPRRTSSTLSRSVFGDASRPGSIRRESRRHSRRSTGNSTSKSPASAFLSQWGKDEAAALAEPDDEGQEIGDHSKYIIGREIGHGGFSSIKEVFTMEDETRIRRAVKIVRKRVQGASESENETVQSKFEHEVSVWRYLRHRHILPLLAVYDTPFATFCITRLNVGGTLFDLVRSSRKAGQKGLSAHLCTRYLAQLASALRYLHEDVRMVHRDVKLENCLIDMTSPDAGSSGGNLQLCDFGMADFITEDNCVSEIVGAARPGQDHPEHGKSVVLGSLEYASPEGLASGGVPMFVTTGDVWAFGVITYTVLVGDLPFRHELAPKLQSKILNSEWDVEALRDATTVREIKGGSAKIEDVVRGCLTVDCADRWKITEVVNSRWLQEYTEPEESEEPESREWA
ncbi:MAG: hypothetical protein M1820_001073 [Bogoriella megaspora]|nr:MAG: hypothetical protein M1820_001073 [Bogoriella megaspora]